jgi:hypothetical protein
LCQLASSALYFLLREKKDSSFLCWSYPQRKLLWYFNAVLLVLRCNKKSTQKCYAEKFY